MNLTISVSSSKISFESRVDYNRRERESFLQNLPSWLRDCVSVYIRLNSDSSIIQAELSIKYLNEFLPFGLRPVRFLWDVLINAHYSAIRPSSSL